MRAWAIHLATFFGGLGLFMSACSGGDSGGGVAGGGAVGSGATAGNAGQGGNAGSAAGGGTGGGSAATGGNAASGGNAGSGTGAAPADAGIPDVAFVYDPPEAGTPEACASVTATASKPPVDIIWIIDQSCSMAGEIAQVKANVNGNFATIIQNSGLDYRVIMFANSNYSTASRQVCVLPPLGAATCGANNPPNFFQVNRSIESYDSLSLFMNATYWNQIKANLRPGALKAFIEVSDDQSNNATAAVFDTFLTTGGGSGYFGTTAKRNYVFHSIVGVNVPLQPNQPKTTSKCSSAVNAGPQYQDLSILTGGLRHPVCDSNYSVVFNNIANSIVTSLACELVTPPQQQPGGLIDWAKVQVEYTPGGTGTPQLFPQVPNAAACAGDGFYYDNPAAPTKAILCPTACTKVKADSNAKLELLLGCLGS
ncbi:MAG TPA: hypothetical protein PKD61_02920 [Polyangiaceae bacterium]|nr:hypothetical protein [Polyangiaceae bacterium]